MANVPTSSPTLADQVQTGPGFPDRFKSIAKAERHIKNFGLEQ